MVLGANFQVKVFHSHSIVLLAIKYDRKRISEYNFIHSFSSFDTNTNDVNSPMTYITNITFLLIVCTISNVHEKLFIIDSKV